MTRHLLTRSTLLLASLLSLIACRKDDDAPPPPPVNAVESAYDYMPAESGSYWIYETYYVDSNGIGEQGNFAGMRAAIDSVYLAKDSVINGAQYHCLMKPESAGSASYMPLFYRDSGMYLVEPTGAILFSPSDTNRTFATRSIPGRPATMDSLIVLRTYCGSTRQKAVPYGTFPTIATVTESSFIPYASDNRPVTRRSQYLRFARNIGIVSETLPYYSMDPGYVERRLVRARIIRVMQ